MANDVKMFIFGGISAILVMYAYIKGHEEGIKEITKEKMTKEETEENSVKE